MHRSEPFLKMLLLILLFLGLAEACTPREGLMSRLSPDGLRHNITSLKTPPLVSPQGLLSLQVLHEETSDCKDEGGRQRCEFGNQNGERAVAGSSRAGREGHQHQSSPWFSPVKPFSGTTPSRKPLPKRKNTWNFLKCAYMVITYLFVSYNKGDWCYCHYCNSELDIRDDPCCSF
nr:epididymal protein 13 [Macaca fascicularis]